MIGSNIDLTVGYVAGIIAAAIVVTRVFCPAIVTYILAGILRDSETASTWTVAGGSLQASLWPYVVRSDSTGNGGRVRTVVRIAAAALPLATFLTAVAGIVTPLGLGQEIVELDEKRGTFEYVRDNGPYEFGTTPRGRYEFSRMCEQGAGLRSGPAACPFSDNIVIFEENATSISWDMPNGYDMSVSDELRTIFSSGTRGQNTTVANFFDIEWRQITTRRDQNLNLNETYAAGLYRQLDSLVLDDDLKLLEGLVVDAKRGGIGFRNHTAPTGLEQGAVWQEDLLFIEPLTTCVNTNITLDFEVTTDTRGASEDIVGSIAFGGFRRVRLTDRGGFYKLNQIYPQTDLSDPQANPDLPGRAYKAAYLHNLYTMAFLNVTDFNGDGNLSSSAYLNSMRGQQFFFGNESTDQDFRKMDISINFGNLLPFSNTSIPAFGRDSEASTKFPNPWDVTGADFDSINVECSGAGNGDAANMSLIYVGCSLMRGTPSRIDNGAPATFEDGSQWSSPLHACASALQVSVKTVEFSMNTTSSLEGIIVRSIAPKKYADNASMSLWGMEKANLTIGGYAPVWGLVSPEYASHENVSTLRSPRLLLPGLSGDDIHATTVNDGLPLLYNLPGANFAFSVMNRVLSINGRAPSSPAWPFDLVGGSSMAIFKRWQAMSSKPDQAASIINLMWTDIAASAVVGTKGVLGEMNGGEGAATVMVRPYGDRITYNYLFGIPAYILALNILVLLVIAIFATCFGQAGLDRVKLRIAQLSAGRIFTTFLYPDDSNLTMYPKDWQKANGEKEVLVGSVARRGEDLEIVHLTSEPFPYHVKSNGFV